MELLLNGLMICAQPQNFGLLLVGIVVGTVFGVIPGLQNVTALSILLPFTYLLLPNQAFLLMIGLYVAGIFGGSITAILYRIPGAPENLATTYDGYPMARRGQAAKALGAAIMASAIGGTISIVIFIAASPYLARVALLFGPIEYFALIFFALTMVAFTGSSPLKSIVSVLLGLLVAGVGMNSTTGASRFTFGSDYLTGGFDIIAVLVGVFAIAEVISRIVTLHADDAETLQHKMQGSGTEFPSFAEMLSVKWTLLRCTGLGVVVGMLPALGATAAALLGYSMEKKLSAQRRNFGQGELAGVVAPEAANNASVGGAMIPLMTLGIPGSASTILMLSAFQIYGMQPGLSLFRDQSELVGVIYAGMLLANIGLVLAGVVAVRVFARMANIPFGVLGPAIVVLCTVGAFAARGSLVDVAAMFGFGVFGYLLERFGFSVSSFVLAFVLGGILESSFVRSMILFDWNPLEFFTSPFSGLLIAAGIVTLIISMMRKGNNELV